MQPNSLISALSLCKGELERKLLQKTPAGTNSTRKWVKNLFVLAWRGGCTQLLHRAARGEGAGAASGAGEEDGTGGALWKWHPQPLRAAVRLGAALAEELVLEPPRCSAANPRLGGSRAPAPTPALAFCRLQLLLDPDTQARAALTLWGNSGFLQSRNKVCVDPFGGDFSKENLCSGSCVSKQGAMSPAGSAAGAALVQSGSKSPAYRNTSAILDIQAVGQQLPGACSSCWGSGSSRTRSGAEEGQCRSRCAAGRQGELTHRLVPGQLGLTAAPSVTVRKKNGSHGIFFCVGLETELRSAKKKRPHLLCRHIGLHIYPPRPP